MILKLKGFYLQNGGSYQNLPNSFDWNQTNVSQENKPYYSIKPYKSDSIHSLEINNLQILKDIEKKCSNLETIEEETKSLGKKKINVEWIILEKPTKKMKKGF